MPDQTVKIMSLSMSEFRRSLVFFAPEITGDEADEYLIGSDEKNLHVHMEEMQPFAPGGLMLLPRCRITLTFSGYEAGERSAILTRFDRTFFRGGG